MDSSALISFLSTFGLPTAIIVAIGLFIDRRLWPWLSEKYWPARLDLAREEVQVMTEIRESLITIRSEVTSNRETTQRLIYAFGEIQASSAIVPTRKSPSKSSRVKDKKLLQASLAGFIPVTPLADRTPSSPNTLVSPLSESRKE